MVEAIDDLIAEKNKLQDKANELKEKRNKLHNKSKSLSDERDDLNKKIRELRNQISDHKKKRDELNKRVQHTKDQRNKLNKTHGEVKKKIENLERERTSSSGTNIKALKKQLRTLEDEQMTKPMSPRKEKKLIEIISDLHTKIKEHEEKLNKDPKLKNAIEEEKIIKQKAEKQHDAVEKLAERAQDQHHKMITLIQQLENMIKKVNEIHEKIVMTKIEADKVHKDFIEKVDKIHDLERNISSTKAKRRKTKKEEEKTLTQDKATEIFERFKRGEKLSTEDLMTLQKAGLI